MRACAENYPPTVNQANLLAESGFRVGMVDLSTDGVVSALSPSIRRWRVQRMWNSKLEPSPPLPRRLSNWWNFWYETRTVIRTVQPKVVVAYDTLAGVFVKPQPRRFTSLYHFHELPEADPKEGISSKWARNKTAAFSRQGGLVVFSDAGRARIYQSQAGLRDSPKVVMNCPRRMAQVPASPLRQELAAAGWAAGRAVCYLGSIGVDQGLLPAARSMRHWPENAVFVLIGDSSADVREQILKAAGEAQAENRVLFLGARPHSEALALVAGAELGLSLIQPHTQNWRHSAGAINKRFEYIALGVPQVSNDGPGVRDILEANQCGLCADPDQPEAIGRAVRQLLDVPEQRRLFSANARSCHLDRFNYEFQFRPVLEWITGAVNEHETS
jgi:glycosyltransferase involved in cell wall biosynthesis